MQLAVIGLGKMGKPMARRLLEAGHSVTVLSRSQGPVEELVTLGARKATTPAEAAAQSSTIITALPDNATVESVCLGPRGIREGAQRGAILIDTSTIRPATVRRIAASLAEAGMEMLDAPVSGGESGAIQGTLSIMVGGAAEAFERALPVLRVLGRTITHIGPSGSGQITKLANQIVVALNYIAIGEGLALGAKAGLDLEKLIQALQGGSAASKCLELKGDRILDGNYQPGGRIPLHIKDLHYALDAAREAGIPAPLTALAAQWFEAAAAAGRADLDHSVVITLFEDLAGVKFRKTPGA